jgi:hypothetical protein
MGRQIWPAAAASAALLLCGCNEGSNGVFGSDSSGTILPEPDPAEQASVVIKDGLRSPDSFEYLSGKVIWSGSHKGNPAYVTLVSYNAQNGFGAMLRACAIVAYSLSRDGKVSWNRSFGMQEADRALCERTGDASQLNELAGSTAKLNFTSDGSSPEVGPDEAGSSANEGPDSNVDAMALVAGLLAAGDYKSASNAARSALIADKQNPQLLLLLARAEAKQMNVGAAVDALEASFDTGFHDPRGAINNPDFDQIRNARLFSALARKYGISQSSNESTSRPKPTRSNIRTGDVSITETSDGRTRIRAGNIVIED